MKSWVRDESGQSLVLVLVSMTLIVGVAALAIDVAGWFVTRHHAQVAADAAALAGANCMAQGGTVSTCSAGKTAPTTIVGENGFSAQDVEFNEPSNGDITVTVSGSGSTNFAAAVGVGSPKISARAVASWQQSDCTTAGSSCAFVYAGDNVCSGNTGVTAVVTATGSNVGAVNHGVTIAGTGTGSGTPITGDVISASNITTNVTGQPQYNSVAAYETGCSSFGGPTQSNPKPYTALYPENVTSQFPIDYRLIYSACGTTSTKFGVVKCDSAGYPNYCTAAQENPATTQTTTTVSSIVTNAIYCDAGSGSKSDPRTWNGTLNVITGGNATFIAGTVDFNDPSNTTLAPAANNALLAYAAECNATVPSTCPTTHTTTTSPVINLVSSGNATITGDIFAPAGVVESNLGGTPNLKGFLEGWDVVYIVNGTVTGQGPPVTSTASFTGDTLIQ